MLSAKEERDALVDAIRYDNLALLKTLVMKHKVKVNRYVRYKEGENVRSFTPISVAIAHASPPVLNYLIQAGADVNKVAYSHTDDQQEKMCPLVLACKMEKLQVIDILAESGADVNSHVLGTKVIEEEGGSFDYGDNHNTCLHWAVMYRKTQLANTLLCAGADPSLLNSSGESALHMACDTYNPAMVEALTKAGGVVNTKDIYGTTVLGSLITYRGDNEEEICLTKLLLTAGYCLSNEDWLFKSTERLSQMHTIRQLAIYKHGEHFIEMLKRHHYDVKSLKHLCRLVVRQRIGCIKLVDKISKLELPTSIRQYLQLHVL